METNFQVPAINVPNSAALAGNDFRVLGRIEVVDHDGVTTLNALECYHSARPSLGSCPATGSPPVITSQARTRIERLVNRAALLRINFYRVAQRACAAKRGVVNSFGG